MNPELAFKVFRENFPPKRMKRPANNPDELKQMARGDGLAFLPDAISPSEISPSPILPQSVATAEKARNLWVITPEEAPIAFEKCLWGQSLESRRIKHSNLTGGADAHSGGEIWFIARDRVIVNSNSGRYGADSLEEFESVVIALRKCGYHVASMGFDIDNPLVPNSILLDNPNWLQPLDDDDLT